MSQEDKEEKDKAVSKIVYIGGDENFFINIQEKFRELFPSIETDFERFHSTDDKVIQSYILKIREIKPKLVLIDFSQNDRAMLHITRIWKRQNFYQDINFIGLSDYKQNRSMVVKAIMTGMACIHIKSLEFESLIYDIAIMAFPGQIENHGFATAEMNDPIHAFYPCKLSLINENFLRFESSVPLKAKQVVRLHTYWDRQKIIRSNLMMCVDQSQENLYYNYKYNQILQMAHAEPVQQTDNMTKEDFEEKQLKRQEIVQESRYKLRKWVLDNQLNSRPKYLKAYVIDKSGIFFDMQPLADSYSFVYRIQPFIANAKREITNIKPQLIIYNLENVDKETLEANADIAHTFNDSRMFQHLIKSTKEVCKDQLPIIVCFNSGQYDSAYMQKVFNYPSILAVKEEMTMELTLKMSEMLKKKIVPNLPQPKKGDIYLDKSTELSYGEIESDITLLGVSENDIYFNSLEPIEPGTVIRVSLPVPMYITVLPAPEHTTISSQYYGIIHGIGEEERKELRRFINSVFFRGLNTEKANDAEEVAKLKQQYVQKQQAEVEERKKIAAAKASEEDDKKQKAKETADRAKEIIDELE